MTPEDLLAAYEERINRHDFDAMVDLIAPDASFLFSDGTFRGIRDIRAAFEATWAALCNDTYQLSNITWVLREDAAAACSYRFDWQTEIDGQPVSGAGRGTTAMRREPDGRWVVVHEHLSPDPELERAKCGSAGS